MKKKVSAPPGPGALFRKKRIENGWSVADVAGALCLSGSQLRALERDDYQNLPGQTYIFGYWRNYENLLGLTIGESLAAHKKHLREAGAKHRPKPRRARNDGNGGESSGHRLGLLFTLLSVIFLLGIWYWQSPPADAPTGGLYQPGDALIGDGDSGGSPDVLADESRDEPRDELAGELTGELTGELPDPNDDIFALLPESMIALPEPSFAEGHDPRQSEAAPDSGLMAAVYNDAAQTGNEPAAVSPPSPATFAANEIAFAVDRESWLEVFDAAGKRLIYRTVAGGQRLTLAGTPPFSVFIGNAAGVAVQYRGEAVPFSGDGTFARFTVGAH